MATFKHPLSENEIVQGEKVEKGDFLKSDDVYPSSSGKWEKCPCPGVILQGEDHTLWVRPYLNE